MAYNGVEKRRFPRINGRFIVSYRIVEENDNVDISQSKNISLGGMLLTTNRKFEPGTNIALEIRLPFDPLPIILVATVLGSREIIENLIYDTRLMFISVDERHKKIIQETVDYYLKKG